MNHHKRITQLKSFQIISVLMMFVVFVSSILIFLNTSLILDLSATGFNDFSTTFNFPIKCIASYLALIGLISLNHRAEQTARQIEVSESQNTFSNHFKNLEEFEKYMANKNPELVHANFYTLYNSIFPNSKDGNLEVDLKFFDSLETKLGEFFDELLMCNSEREKEKLNTESILIVLDSIEMELSVFFNDKNGVYLAENNRNFFGMLTEHQTIHSRIYDQRYYINGLTSILDFENINYTDSNLAKLYIVSSVYEKIITNFEGGREYTISLEKFKSMLEQL